MAVATTSRDDEIRLIWTEHQWLYMVTGFTGGILFCLLTQLSINNLPELLISLLPEAAGILVTVTIIDVLNRRRDERRDRMREEHELKLSLAWDVRNSSNAQVVTNAIDQMRKYGWLAGNDGLLAGATLYKTDLQGAKLKDTNFQGADLNGVNLQEAELLEANLQGSRLKYVNLEKANLFKANLKEADLDTVSLQKAILVEGNLQEVLFYNVNLQGARLIRANLQGAAFLFSNLQGANLMGANLEGAEFNLGEYRVEFDEKTRLPDGTFWTTETDMRKFTNPSSDKAVIQE